MLVALLYRHTQQSDLAVATPAPSGDASGDRGAPQIVTVALSDDATVDSILSQVRASFGATNRASTESPEANVAFSLVHGDAGAAAARRCPL